MTDNEIIKALECCVNWNCKECPFFVKKGNCTRTFDAELLGIINRQKAEIERLQTEKDNLIRIYKECMTEAIKEFAEEFEKRCIANGIYPALIKNILKNLVKELTEGSNA